MKKSLAWKCLILIFPLLFTSCVAGSRQTSKEEDLPDTKPDYIRWIDFKMTESALSAALRLDVESVVSEIHVEWVELLALYATRHGGDFSKCDKKELRKLCDDLQSGRSPSDLVSDQKLYAYYKEAYSAVLGGMVGYYTEVRTIADGETQTEEKYGLRAFSPLAAGYYYNDYDDFGVARSYGYKRNHLGHDLIGAIGTPVIAVESGYVEHLGWNQYGGWRVGIRSLDGKRYYYYAHLRKNSPYVEGLFEGQYIHAGEVIGYLGMTGYSVKENVNGINTPHLHFGLQIIFDPSQTDGWNQIWIDLYALTGFLAQNRAPVTGNASGQKVSTVYNIYPEEPD